MSWNLSGYSILTEVDADLPLLLSRTISSMCMMVYVQWKDEMIKSSGSLDRLR